MYVFEQKHTNTINYCYIYIYIRNIAFYRMILTMVVTKKIHLYISIVMYTVYVQ